MKRLGVGVIGTGFMGEMHARIYNSLPNVRLIGVTDQNSERAGKLAAELKVKSFDSYRKLLEDPEIEAVSICVSDDNHLEPTVAACEAGKNIMLEKPIATKLEEAKAIVEAVRKNRIRMTVGHLLRFDTRYLQLKKYVDSGGIGKPITIYTRRNSPISDGPARYGSKGCLTLHVVVHDLDLILWVMSKKVVRVYAERAKIALKDHDIDDAVFATLKFEDGSIGAIQYNWILPKNYPTHIDAKMQVIGTHGSASVDCADQGIWTCGPEGYQWPDTTHWPEISGEIRGDLREELAGFVDALQNDKKFAITPEESLSAVELALAIMKSIEEEKVVEL